ncbi:MAG: T9SS type A sorting domain-containing protein, partial [Bacteroidetes bacterium]|nr:T9SS type A sorting domain-containing protein [Bacteroidota bacterium]
GEWANLAMSPYFPKDTGTYTVSYFVSIDETDSHLSNNTAFSTKSLMINDSVFARDIGPASNGLSIGNGTTGEFGLNFSFSKTSLLHSVSVFLVNSNNIMVGEPISVKVYAFRDSPSVEVAFTDTLIVTQSGAHWLNLPLSGGPFLLDSGTWTFSVQEGKSLISLGYTRDIFTPETAWIRSEGISWVTSETLGFPVAFMIRPNVFCRLRAGINGIIDNACPDDTDGAIDIFASGGTPPYMFSWSNGNTEEDADRLPLGIYTAVVTDAEGCVVKIPETIISSNDSFPDGNITVMISDQGVRFLANSSYGKSFYWDFGDGQTSNVENPFHTYLSHGTYHILLTIHNDCGTSTFTKVIYVGDITSNITLAPNPNPGTFSLHFEDLKLKNVIISIFTQTGQNMYSETLESVESPYEHAVNPERRLAQGIYILEIRSKKSRIYKKFWVK